MTKRVTCLAAGYSNGSGNINDSRNRASIRAKIDTAIQETNQAYRASDINGYLNLVYVHYDDTINKRLSQYNWEPLILGLARKNDGILDVVHGLRDRYGADFVSMWIDRTEYCGLGFTPFRPSPGEAFTLVRYTCATGYYSFGHEIAHNMVRTIKSRMCAALLLFFFLTGP